MIDWRGASRRKRGLRRLNSILRWTHVSHHKSSIAAFVQPNLESARSRKRAGFESLAPFASRTLFCRFVAQA